MQYEPSPIDTSKVNLSNDLWMFVELLARNNHDVWARERKREGWQWGPERNDERKEHPDLVPYEALSEGEKVYERISASESMKTILALGGIVQPPRQADLPRTQEQLRKSGRGALLDQWRSRRPRELSLDEYQRLAEGMLDLQEPLLAFDIASEGLKNWPTHVRLRQVKARALTRSGSPEEAESVLNTLVDEGNRDPETLGLLARVKTDYGLRATEPGERGRLLRGAYDSYLAAYRSPADYWTGINAATLGLLLGETGRAKRMAEQIRATCLEELRKADGPGGYWLQATIGEAALILQSWDEAEEYYSRASGTAPDNLANLVATRRNAHLILNHYKQNTARFDRCFKVPQVAVFAGHLADPPGRSSPRFPDDPEFETRLRNAIREHLKPLNIRIGYAAAGSGSDILFLEAIREVGGRIYVVLPCDKEQFLRESVVSSGGNWAARFEELCKEADDVIFASHQRLTIGSASYDYANDVLQGLAQIRAEQLDTGLFRIAVWDGKPGIGAGGTADIVARWRRTGEVHVIDPVAVREGRSGISVLPVTEKTHTRPDPVVAMLFGDVRNFSGLTEEQIPLFIEHFQNAVARLAGRANPKPFVNTWGDGLFLVFKDLRSAGKLAMELLDLVKVTKWGDLGLRDDFTLRVALHAGPVYEYADPFRDGGRNYIGTHVNRAARMEPVTPPGHIYVSQAFAALARVQGIDDFQFVYAGETELPKSAGLIPLYSMRAAPGRV